MNPADFVRQVDGELHTRDLGELAAVSFNGSELVVRFRWMGTSELRYRVEEREGGFSAALVDERISPLHAPFKQRFIERFDQIIESVGGRSV